MFGHSHEQRSAGSSDQFLPENCQEILSCVIIFLPVTGHSLISLIIIFSSDIRMIFLLESLTFSALLGLIQLNKWHAQTCIIIKVIDVHRNITSCTHIQQLVPFYCAHLKTELAMRQMESSAMLPVIFPSTKQSRRSEPYFLTFS